MKPASSSSLKSAGRKCGASASAEATRATLQAAKQRFPTLGTPESTGKADFPHDLEKAHFSVVVATSPARGRKSLDRELQKVDTSLSQAVEVD